MESLKYYTEHETFQLNTGRSINSLKTFLSIQFVLVDVVVRFYFFLFLYSSLRPLECLFACVRCVVCGDMFEMKEIIKDCLSQWHGINTICQCICAKIWYYSIKKNGDTNNTMRFTLSKILELNEESHNYWRQTNHWNRDESRKRGEKNKK